MPACLDITIHVIPPLRSIVDEGKMLSVAG